jgi:hypothetical protein
MLNLASTRPWVLRAFLNGNPSWRSPALEAHLAELETARSRALERAKGRADGCALIQDLYCGVLDQRIRRLTAQAAAAIASGGSPSVPAIVEMLDRYQSWFAGLAECGEKVFLFECPNDGRFKGVASCCQAALCPREQRRRSWRWQERAVAIEKHLGRRRGYGWKMLTVSLRQRGTLEEVVDATVKMRAALARELTREYGMLAGLGAIELGEHDNVHVHFVVYCRFAPRPAIQHWLQARDCTVPECRHMPDDRCVACKRAGKCQSSESGGRHRYGRDGSCEFCHAARPGPCTHPDVSGCRQPLKASASTASRGPLVRREPRLGRQRCNGSWYVDIRPAYAKRSAGSAVPGRPSIASAAREAIKYAAAPVLACVPLVNEDGTPNAEQVRHAERVIDFYVALRGRHRVETYGLAKNRALGEESAPEDVEPDPAGDRDHDEHDDRDGAMSSEAADGPPREGRAANEEHESEGPGEDHVDSQPCGGHAVGEGRGAGGPEHEQADRQPHEVRAARDGHRSDDPKADQPDDGRPRKAPRCPRCRAPMFLVAVGTRIRLGPHQSQYVWERPHRPSG